MTDLANLPFPHPRQFPKKDDIRHANSIIERLDRRIEALESDISKLQAQLQQIQQKRVNYASYISPLRRLPTELLSVIVDIYLKQGGGITEIASVCSRLREVVLGMAGIWSNISLRDVKTKTAHAYTFLRIFNRPYGSSFEGGIQCTTLEQLTLVLTRAGASPLKLSVSWPVEIGTLELIAERKCQICSLTISDSLGTLGISNFRDLNLGQLQQLQLGSLQWDQSRQIMDLALQSSCNKMTLDINYGLHSLELFQHELMQRVVNIGIVADVFTNQLYHESSGLKEIPFPNIETWRLEGESELLRSLDLSGAKKLEFTSIDYPFRPIMANFSDDLTTLDLACVILTLNSLPDGQRQSLPCLTSLILEDVIFIGPFQKYFHCPRLGYLSYVISPDVSVDENIVEGRKDYYKTPIRETFDDTFFRESSTLSTLFLGGTTMDTALARTLAGCPMLHTLRIQDNRIVDFIHPFMEQLADTAKFQSLKHLSIDSSWPGEVDISYEEFTAQCSSIRPRLDIMGNNEQEFVKTPPEDAALQFDLDGMDEDYIGPADGGEWSFW